METIERELHERFSLFGQNAREWMRKCAVLLPEINRRAIWRKKGFSSIYEYAAKLAGMSRSSVEDALRVMKKVEAMPDLLEVVETRGINRVRPIAAIATPETAAFWAEKAMSMSKTTLETYVRNYRLESRTSTGVLPAKHSVTFTVSSPLAKRLEQFKKRGDFEEKLMEMLDKLDSDIPEPVQTASRHIPVRIQRFVRQRTGGRCAYPGCLSEASSLHHTQRWSLEKVHDPARLHAMCTAHERLAHLGLIDNEDASPQHWSLRNRAGTDLYNNYVDHLVALHRPT